MFLSKCRQYVDNRSYFIVADFMSIVFLHGKIRMPTPVAARSKAWVYGSSLTGIVRSNTARGEWMSPVSVRCCAGRGLCGGRSLVQRNPTECDVSGCDRVTSQRKPELTRS